MVRLLLIFSGVSLIVQGTPLGAEKPSLNRSNTHQLASARVQWWSYSGVTLEPVDSEESGEEIDQVAQQSCVLLPPNSVPVLNAPASSLSFLAIYSGCLQFLNIPPPYFS